MRSVLWTMYAEEQIPQSSTKSLENRLTNVLQEERAPYWEARAAQPRPATGSRVQDSESAPTAEQQQPVDQARPTPEPAVDPGLQPAPAIGGNSGFVSESASVRPPTDDASGGVVPNEPADLLTGDRQMLNVARIGAWMKDEGWTNEELAERLNISERTVSSIRNNGKYHGSDAVNKLANLMGCDPIDLYLP
jgi:DNA-binding Xre family transcriptional regulator